jgi:ubiquinone/menaquinone biosynthesis C-methylase UbiE
MSKKNSYSNDPKGDVEAFEANWKNRIETSYIHWTRGQPINQIQLAFRRHWLTFQRLLDGREGNRRCLEVGCGRGSLSAYFANAGWDCTLLDLSPSAIECAQKAFDKEGLFAKFDIGDCLNLPYPDNSFDLVFSIGLLEHFQEIDKVISEQVRVLAPGGLFIGYVVPVLPENLQKNYEWINDLLRSLLLVKTNEASTDKTNLYRSNALSPPYLAVMKDLGLEEIGHGGVYSLPMISHSPAFPFSLLPSEAEKNLVNTFEKWLAEREKVSGSDPWLCAEGEGQAFLVWGRKN